MNPEAADLRNTLRQRNIALARDCTTLESMLAGASIPALLEPYRSKMVSTCRKYQLEAETNLTLLGLRSDSILEDVLSKTRVASYYLRLLKFIESSVICW